MSFRKISPSLHNSVAAMTIAKLIQILLSRYEAGYIGDNNQQRILSEVKY